MQVDDSTLLNLAGTSTNVASSLVQGGASASSFRSQAAADDYNAAAAARNAVQTAAEGTQRELLTRQKSAQEMGVARAAAGEANIGGPQGGTIAGVLEQDSVNAELDALSVRYQTDTKRAAYLDESALDSYNAKEARKNATMAMIGGVTGALSGVVGGANRYYAQKQALANASAPAPSFKAGAPVATSSDDYFSFSNKPVNPYLSAAKGGF